MAVPTPPKASTRSVRGSKLAAMPEHQLHESLVAHLRRILANPNPIVGLRDTSRAIGMLLEIERRMVLAAREDNVTWARIAMSMGVTVQATWSRFARARTIPDSAQGLTKFYLDRL